MAGTVLNEWGINQSSDVGAMVFNLVEVGAFGRTENDSPKDFENGFDFKEAFEDPFLPKGRLNKDHPCDQNEESEPKEK